MVVWLNEEKSNCLLKESVDVIILSTFFKPEDKVLPGLPMDYKLTPASILLLEEITKTLKYGGLLFIYGLPHHLAFWGQYVSLLQDEEKQMIFKYWIALDIDNALSTNALKPSHLGLLMFSKSKSKALSPSSFHLNTDLVRVSHSYCSACGQNVKDWGGKKHLMNPNGTAISDVWRDLPKIDLKNNVIPKTVLNRIESLTKKDNTVYLHITQTQPNIEITVSQPRLETKLNADSDNEKTNFNILEKDKVYQGDSISFLSRVYQLHPQGIFDLVFADPPYNLKKGYNRYEDSLAEKNYINWCNKWLEIVVKTLKPGGTLIILNLPKWAIHHAAFLNTKLEFRNWVVWDALSDPRGKIMPAHYALLYYTKTGKKMYLIILL